MAKKGKKYPPRTKKIEGKSYEYVKTISKSARYRGKKPGVSKRTFDSVLGKDLVDLYVHVDKRKKKK